MDRTKPVVHAFAAAFFALGEAVGGNALQRAGAHLRDLLADPAIDDDTADILSDLLAGVDHHEDFSWWTEINSRPPLRVVGA